MKRRFFLLAVLALTGCSAGLQDAAQYQCVPYARQVSGIQLQGDAWTWWEAAAGRYVRAPRPDRGAVLVLRRSETLRHGHVAVVTALHDARTIDVTHVNWGYDDKTRRRVHARMRVIDVSRGNDWSLVRFWNEDASVFGKPYAAHGFILPSARA
jgi:surface antigen